jgi:hypothetical protein
MKRFHICLAVLACVCLIGCASANKNMVVAYSATGATIETVHQVTANMCTAGTIKAADCDKIKTLYNKIRDGYLTSGTALILYLNTSDAVQKKTNLEAYQTAIATLSQLVAELLTLVQSYGVEVTQ